MSGQIGSRPILLGHRPLLSNRIGSCPTQSLNIPSSVADAWAGQHPMRQFVVSLQGRTLSRRRCFRLRRQRALQREQPPIQGP
jgi:hypothetical protein